MAQIITNCPKCQHQFCFGCGIVWHEVHDKKARETTCHSVAIQCCNCNERTDTIPIFQWRQKRPDAKGLIEFVNEATSEGEKEK